MNRNKILLTFLAGVFISSISSCSIFNLLSLKKVPQPSSLSGYYLGTIPGFETGFNQVIIHVDTLGSTQIYALKSLKGLQLQTYSAQLKVQKDSSYNLVMANKTHIFLKRTGEQSIQLKVKNTQDSLFESGKHDLRYLDKNVLSNREIEEILLRESGVYMLCKTPNKNVYLRLDQNLVFQDPKTLKETQYRLLLKDIERLADGTLQTTIETQTGPLFIQFIPNQGENSYAMSIYDSWQGEAWNSKGNPVIEGHAILINPGFLLNGNWELTHLKTYEIKYIRFSHVTPNLTIQRLGSSFIGHNGCNQIFGSFVVDGNQLTLKDPIGATKKFCEDTDDQLFLEMLESVHSYSVSGNILTLQTQEGPMTFTLKSPTQ